ncbi:MAG: hypothetical protein JOZ98_16980 [Solirubrobacterales bacterium]|nr:hypothetical protein [Solirubrobacterales bacterium]MBV9424608.1 hypothetical protein [Solirubrobacterales bacterium]MBV9796481.1 hypothetical protein [Solirubrobacterales bacterium]
MATFLLSHHHTAVQCAPMFAAWRGFASPLRHRDALSSCPHGGHGLWWLVEAPDEAAALGQLPECVSRQTEVTRVRPFPIP